MEITTTSTVDECITAINEAAEDLAGEYPDVSPDEFWTDLASSMLVDANEAVAREVCRCELGFTPMALEQLWNQRRVHVLTK